MPLRAARPMLMPMTLTIHIALNVNGESISGVASAGGEPVRFHGWLGLMSAVDSLATATPDDAHDALASRRLDAGGPRTRTHH